MMINDDGDWCFGVLGKVRDLIYRKVKEFCQKASIEELRSKGAARVINWNGYEV